MSSAFHELGLTVVAGGVENTAEMGVLDELGVDAVQGFLFAKPGPPFPRVTWPR